MCVLVGVGVDEKVSLCVFMYLRLCVSMGTCFSGCALHENVCNRVHISLSVCLLACLKMSASM